KARTPPLRWWTSRAGIKSRRSFSRGSQNANGSWHFRGISSSKSWAWRKTCRLSSCRNGIRLPQTTELETCMHEPHRPNFQRQLRIRVAVFLLALVLCLLVLNSLHRALNTIGYLDGVESERDQWQRPPDVIRAIGATEGKTVADIGSGAGYFSLRLSRAVGPAGKVLAVDIRKLPLAFLWARAL